MQQIILQQDQEDVGEEIEKAAIGDKDGSTGIKRDEVISTLESLNESKRYLGYL